MCQEVNWQSRKKRCWLLIRICMGFYLWYDVSLRERWRWLDVWIVDAWLNSARSVWYLTLRLHLENILRLLDDGSISDVY